MKNTKSPELVKIKMFAFIASLFLLNIAFTTKQTTDSTKVKKVVPVKMIKDTSDKVKSFPKPHALVANITDTGRISKYTLLAQKGVEASTLSFTYDIKYTVVAFTVSTIDNGYTVEKSSKTNEFTPEQKALIERAKSGQKIIIRDIYSVGPDMKIIQLDPIVLTLY